MIQDDQELAKTLGLFREIIEGQGYEPDGAKVWWNNRDARLSIKSGFAHGELWLAVYDTTRVRTQIGTTHHFTGHFNEFDLLRVLTQVEERADSVRGGATP